MTNYFNGLILHLPISITKQISICKPIGKIGCDKRNNKPPCLETMFIALNLLPSHRTKYIKLLVLISYHNVSSFLLLLQERRKYLGSSDIDFVVAVRLQSLLGPFEPFCQVFVRTIVVFKRLKINKILSQIIQQTNTNEVSSCRNSR